MPIVETNNCFEGAFDELICPVCGACAWVHIVYQGIFCKKCNTECSLRTPNGDTGFVATFDSHSTWDSEDAEPIPECEEYGAVASGKWLGSQSQGYDLYWFSPKAEYTDEYDGDWLPVWERESEPDYLIDLSPSEKDGTSRIQDGAS